MDWVLMDDLLPEVDHFVQLLGDSERVGLVLVKSYLVAPLFFGN